MATAYIDTKNRKNRMARKQNKLLATSRNPHCEKAVVANGSGRHMGTTLALPSEELDMDELLAVTREWLAPALVEKFLREHKHEPMNVPVKTNKSKNDKYRPLS